MNDSRILNRFDDGTVELIPTFEQWCSDRGYDFRELALDHSVRDVAIAEYETATGGTAETEFNVRSYRGEIDPETRRPAKLAEANF